MDVEGQLDQDGNLLTGSQEDPGRSNLQRRQAGGPTNQPAAGSLQGADSDDDSEHHASLASAAVQEILIRDEGLLSPTPSGSNCLLGNDCQTLVFA